MIKKITGFTLIEILVVATIIIVLTAIGVASFSSASKNARDSKRKADMETLRQAQVLYKTQNGRYATSQSELNSFVSPPFPQDPKTTTPYVLTFDTSSPVGESFCFCADVELDKGNQTMSNCGGSWGSTGGFYCSRQPY